MGTGDNWRPFDEGANLEYGISSSIISLSYNFTACFESGLPSDKLSVKENSCEKLRKVGNSFFGSFNDRNKTFSDKWRILFVELEGL